MNQNKYGPIYATELKLQDRGNIVQNLVVSETREAGEVEWEKKNTIFSHYTLPVSLVLLTTT